MAKADSARAAADTVGRPKLRSRFALSGLVLALSWFGDPRAAAAGCCRVARVDGDSPSVPIRICEADTDGQCDLVLFQGSLAVGDSQTVCSASATIVYQNDDGSGGYGPPTQARCDGVDVEI